MKQDQQNICRHCGVSYRWAPLMVAEADDRSINFCCRGCLGAYQLICNAGLSDFYGRSGRTTPTVDASASRFSSEELAGYVVPDRDCCRLDIMVGGITCPSCIWLLERMIGRVEGVSEVSISYAGGIASVRFDPLVAEPAGIFSVISSLGYSPRPYSQQLSEKEAGREKQDLLIRFGTALFLVMQLMAYSYSLYAGYFQGISSSMKNFLQYVSLLVATPVVFYCGRPFLYAGWKSFVARRPGMDLLISVGALSAWCYSVWGVFARQETYFESAAMIVTFVLAGRLLENMVKQRAMSGIESLYAAVPQRAIRGEEGEQREVPVDSLCPGDIILVRQGDKFPVDVLIVRGETEVDQALVTGESVPVLVGIGDEIRAGSVNSTAPVYAQVLRPVGQSYLMRVAALVQMAQSGKPSLQRLADKVAGWFVPAVILLAALVLGYHVLVGHRIVTGIMSALAVVLIACPCAMGLAVPTAVLAACSRSAALGIIVRGGDVLERLASIRHACFDKTGTITLGMPTVYECRFFEPFDPADVVSATVTLEQMSQHPLAGAIRRYGAETGILPSGIVAEIQVVPGRGIAGTLTGNRRVLCGSEKFLAEQGVATDISLVEMSDGSCVGEKFSTHGNTFVWVAIDGKPAACFVLHDSIRSGAEKLVAGMKKRGVATHLMSGDAPASVASIATATSIERYHSEMLPDAKLAMICELQSAGAAVLMVGDGVNDAPSLAAADVSCSLTGSSDIALENSDVIITGDDLSRLATAHRIALKTMTIIKQNLAWAFLYNIIGIPLAMSGVLTPLYAAVAMTASSLMVSLNSLRLMRIKHNG